ncbi:FemAB family protein [Gemella bergeri ATCC 700627]|uniref:Lipid II:glycine glycyltransferase n=1 Tax=Gemella bergeri ATCC 700627 TaxID=1321820 RepID=U2SBA8_9BACL|nr:peptidoglycan bridge formation glycyltransferase FemA/FemB family protein [Gemella bergeri]ERK60042.1 FemAB family protein [Gemella bergeri ATCC 700627]
MFEIDLDIDNKKFDSFVKEHSTGELLQLASWGEVKSANEWYFEKIAIKNNNKVVASCLVLFRRLGLGKYTIAYIPKGYTGDNKNSELNIKIINEIKKLCKKHHAILIDFETNVLRNSSNILVDDLRSQGFKIRGHEEKDFPYQTQYDMVVYFKDLETDTREYLNKKTERLLRVAEKAELKIENVGLEKVDIFTRLSDETSERNGISLRNNDYYKNIIEFFKRDNNVDFYLISLDANTFKNNIENNIKLLEKEISGLQKKVNRSSDEKKKEVWETTITEIRNKINSLNKDIEEILKYKSDTIYLSGCLVLYCGKKSYYLYAASSNKFRYLQPNIYMNYKAMENARKRGCISYNLGGVKSINDNLYTFKKSLGGECVEYEGVFTYVVNRPIYILFETALKIRKKLIKIKNKRK